MKSFSPRIVISVLLVFMSSGPKLLAQIPTISIQTSEDIVDEPKVLGIFTYTGVDGEIISGNIGIEIRGGFSQSFPKKTYDIEFWEDMTGSETMDVQIGALRKDDDWILDAMYNEPLRLNSYLTHKLWLDINELYYQADEPKAKSGADVMYAEVTINGDYQGIYLLSEQVDRKQLKLKRNVGTTIRGELYKAYDSDDATFFNNPDETPDNDSFTWSGYEFRYPSDFIDWTNVADIVDFVANSSEDEFMAEVEGRFDFQNLMDYYILLNVARILDNRGKNIYLCRYDADEPYFLTPWDLDGSWGLSWDGSNDSNTKGPLTNNLFSRLIETNAGDFRQRVSSRWKELRMSLLNENVLNNRINEIHQFLMSNMIYEKESNTWEYEYSDASLGYMLNWITKRFEFLDPYFDAITSTKKEITESSFDIFPNPSRDYFTISTSKQSTTSIKIYNLMGQFMKRVEGIPNGGKVSTDDLPAGSYIIEWEGGNKLFYKI